MKNVIAGLLLIILACTNVAFARDDYPSLSHASALVARQLLAFENEPDLDLSSYFARAQEIEKTLAADLLKLQAADWAGAEAKKAAALAFSSRAISVIRTNTSRVRAGMIASMTQRRLLEAERVWPLQTDPELAKQALQRLQVARDQHEQAIRDGVHQASAMSMHCELLLAEDDAVKTAFGQEKGLDAQTRAFIKQYL